MTRILKSTLILALVALPTIYACSQVPPPPVAPPLAGPAGPFGPAGPAGPDARHIRQLLTLQGTLKGYTGNDDNEYDGFTLDGSGQTTNVRFPPHMAAQLMAVAKAGGTVSLQGFYETTPEGLNVVHLVNITTGGQTIYDTPPADPATPPTMTIQPFNGNITDLRRDRNGMPTGILLSGSRIVDLTPGVYDQLQAYLKPGTAISGSGSIETPPSGVVLVMKTQTIHPQTLTVNGQTYMVR